MKETRRIKKVGKFPAFVLIIVVVSFVIVLWVFLVGLFSPPVQCDIVNVQKETHTYVIDDVEYLDFFFDVDIVNSGDRDVADVELVADLRVDGAIVDSHPKIIGTLKAGSEYKSMLSIWSVPNSELFDTQGNQKGTITALITLYYGDRVLDQLTTEIF